MSASAAAAATTYASPTGSDGTTSAANNCQAIANPCLTISHAWTKAVSGGGFPRVMLVGGGVFKDAVTMTASGEIIGDAGVSQIIVPPAGQAAGLTVNVGAGGVRLANFQIIGSSNSTPTGISVTSVSNFELDNVEVHGVSTFALSVTPNNNSFVQIAITSSKIGDNLTGSCAVFKPTGSLGVHAVIVNSVFEVCAGDILDLDASGLGAAAPMQTVIRNSTLTSGGANGVTAISAANAAFSSVVIEASSVTSIHNNLVYANGPNSEVVLNNSTVSWGGTAVNAANGGVVRSFKNNDIRDTNNDNIGILSSLAYH